MTKSKNTNFDDQQLSRRERQIMSAVYKLGEATIADIIANIPEPPTADAIRRLCHILREKGQLQAHTEGTKNVFSPMVGVKKARRSALNGLIDTFFGGSANSLVTTLLDTHGDNFSEQDLERLSQMIDDASNDSDKKS